jgi:hypothetical protein
MASAKKFTSNKQPPNTGNRFGLKSPILAGYDSTRDSTMGVVESVTDMGADRLDRCVVFFRGESIRATCCHPDIKVGMNVCMIEQPIGVWWATVLQRSWYSRPLAELIEKGRPYQAALEYLLSFGPKWRPQLIIIDKRGQTPPAPWPPVDQPFPWNVSGEVPSVPIDPETGQPYTFDDLDDDNDGKLSPDEWPFDPYLFDFADTNGDGFISLSEWNAFWNFWTTTTPLTTLPDHIDVYASSISMGVPDAAYYAAVAAMRAACNVAISAANAEKQVVFYLNGGVPAWLPVVYVLYQFGPATYLGSQLTYVWGACIFVGSEADYWPWNA